MRDLVGSIRSFKMNSGYLRILATDLIQDTCLIELLSVNVNGEMVPTGDRSERGLNYVLSYSEELFKDDLEAIKHFRQTRFFEFKYRLGSVI